MSSTMVTEQARLDTGEQHRQSAMGNHAKAVVVMTRMRREQTTLVAMLAAAEKLRRSMAATVIAGAEFNRIFGGLNSVVASSALHLSEQRARVTGLVDLLAGQNAAMHTVSIALEQQFIKPLEITATGWKAQAAAQEAQEIKYSKTQSKKSAVLIKQALTARQARDKVIQGTGTANEAKTAKATGKLNDVLVEYDRFFEQYAMTAQGFYDDAEREEKARYSSIVKASTMVARGMGSLAEHADGFNEWVGGASAKRGKTTQKPAGTSSSSAREALLALQSDDEAEADEYIDVTGADRPGAGAAGDTGADEGVATWLTQHQKPDPAQYAAQPAPRHTGSLSLRDDGGAVHAPPMSSASPAAAAQQQRGEASSPDRRSTVGAQLPATQQARNGGGGGGGGGRGGGGGGAMAPVHEEGEPAPQGAHTAFGVWSSKRQTNRTSVRGSSLRRPTSTPEGAGDPHGPDGTTVYTGNAVVIFPYTPAMSDELALATGMSVEVLHESDDGWVNGVEVATGEKGWFHRSFVQRDEDAVYFITRKSFTAGKSVAGQQRAMGFGPDERMRILDKTSEQWWMAMNVSSLPSETGFIPASFVDEERKPKPRTRRLSSASDMPTAPRRGVKKGKSGKAAQLRLTAHTDGDGSSA